MNAQIIALVNQKGSVGKSISCVNLGVGLVQAGKKVLLVDRRYCFANVALFVAEDHDFSNFLHVRFLYKISIVPYLAFPTLFYWILTDAHIFPCCFDIFPFRPFYEHYV